MSPTREQVEAAIAYASDSETKEQAELLSEYIGKRYMAACEILAAEVRRLSEDAKRLDWLETCCPMPHHCIVLGEENASRRHSLWLHGERFEGATLRAAIDAAMKGTT